MHTFLVPEFTRARAEEHQRHAASVRRARDAARARHPRRHPRIRRRLDLAAALESVARRFTSSGSGARVAAQQPGAGLIEARRAQRS
jgi:hypothetical protein